jgi:hypothetical protein
MSPLPIAIALALTAQPATPFEAPDAEAIQTAMNDGVDLDFAEFQELAAVTIRYGGATQRNDYLFLCEGNLVWKVSSKEFKEIFKKAINEESGKLGGQGALLKAFSPWILARLDQIGSFNKGQTVTKTRFRVRIERAGKDWVVTSSKIIEFDTNPLRNVMSKDKNAS